MHDNGSHQLQTIAGERICEIVRASEALDRTKIASKLYNGSYLMQTIGTPTRKLNLDLRAWSTDELEAVNEAEASCQLVVAKIGSDLFTGMILDAPSWNVIIDGSIYETSVTIAEVET